MNRFKKQRQQQQEAQGAAAAAAASVADDEGAVTEGEEDYMSEALLAQLEQEQQKQQQASSSTIGRKRPKPSSASASASAAPLSRKAKQEQAEAKLQEGLRTPLPEDNPGLRLLKLMGFKTGTGLGKSAAGIAEPLQIVRRLGREGIGVHEGKHERAGRQEELVRLRAEWAEKRKADFTQAMSNKFAERRVAGHLARAMKTVETLDTRAGRPRSCLWWSSEHGDGQEEGEEEEQGGGEAGAGAEAEADAVAAAEGPKEEAEEDDEQDLWPSLTNAEKLNVVTAYLRGGYFYCCYCGHQFDGPEELARECPGEAEEDH